MLFGHQPDLLKTHFLLLSCSSPHHHVEMRRDGKPISKQSGDDLPPMLFGTDWELLKVAMSKDTSKKRGSSVLSMAPEVPPM